MNAQTKLRIMMALDQSIREEKKAVADYRARGAYAADAGDAQTAHVYKHIMAEEQEHVREFKARLRLLRKSKG